MKWGSTKLPRENASILLHLLVVLSTISGVMVMQRVQLQKPSLSQETPQNAEKQEHFRLAVLNKLPSFGFDNLVANWTFLNFIQYYGDEPARKQTGYSLSPEYFEIMTQRDPRFVDSYLFLSGSVSHQLGKPKETLRLMQRGMEALSSQNTSRAFVVWRFAALDQLLLLGDYSGAIRSFEMASKWAGQTEEYKELEQVFQNSANFLKRNPDSRLVRFQAWSLVYEQAIAIGDKPTQVRAEREIIALGGVKREQEGREIFVLPESIRSQKSQKI
jgi:hypothetical protein